MANMRAVSIRGGVGPATALYIDDKFALPKPAEGQALVEVFAFGINRMDLLQREGRYPVPPQAPSTLGVEFSGKIKELGSESTSFHIGDEICGLAYGGAYAEYVVVDVRMLLHKPGHLTWEQCAAIPEAWITATQALHLVGAFQKGNTVLWHAGASSVSIAGVQLAARAGASKVFVTAGSQEKVDFCVQKLGATAGFNYHTTDWAKEVLAATDGKGVDVILDFVGQNYFQGNLDAAARDGRIVQLGTLSGTKLGPNVDISAFVAKRLRFEGTTLRSRDLEYQERLRNKLEEYFPDFESGSLQVFLDRVMSWEQIVEAHQAMENNSTKGKIVCTIDRHE